MSRASIKKGPRRLAEVGYSESAANLEKYLRHVVRGQDAAIDTVVGAYNKFTLGLNQPDRPIANLLFLGPTGTGKTHLVEVMAQYLLGTRRAVTKVDCAEYQHGHEVAKLVGSPPGYTGHKETKPLLSQENLDQYQTENCKVNFLLLDEVEKANETLWNFLLGAMDKGTVSLGNNQKVDLTKTFIIMTSNAAARDMEKVAKGNIGFGIAVETDGGGIERVVDKAARNVWAPEFINRLDRMVIFKPLSQDTLEGILDLELANLETRLFLSGRDIHLVVSPEAKEYLLKEGTDKLYNARHLKRAVEKYLFDKLVLCLPEEAVGKTSLIYVGYEYGMMVFDYEEYKVRG